MIEEALFDVFWSSRGERHCVSTNHRDTALRASIVLSEGGAEDVFVSHSELAEVPAGVCAEVARSINGKLMEQRAALLLRAREAERDRDLYRALVEGPLVEARG